MPAPRLLTPGLGEMLVVRPQHVRRREVEKLTSSLQPGKAHRFRRSRCGRRGDPARAGDDRRPAPRRAGQDRWQAPRSRPLLPSPATARPGDGSGVRGAIGESVVACTAPASTSRPRRRASWKGRRIGGGWRRPPSWSSAACAAPGWDCGHEACAGVPECFSFLCSAACIPSNDSFTMAPHPDVGEGAGPLPVRPGRAFYLPVPESPR